jgi:hypothetical protein
MTISGKVGQIVSARTEEFPRSPTSSREDRPNPPMKCRPNSRRRSPQTLVGKGTHRAIAEGAGRPSENFGVLASDGRQITRPIQLVISLKVDQDREDVGNS